MPDENKQPLFPIVGTSLNDNIPLLDQVVDLNDVNELASIPTETIDSEKLELLRKQFETNMNKKIRKRLQETEKQLQKELQNQLDNLFKQIKK